MANAGLAWVNHLASAASVIATNSEVSSLPLSNIRDLHGVTVWRTQAATGISVTADLGAVQPVKALGIACATLSASATWRLRLSSSGAHGGDLYDSGILAMNRALIARSRGQAFLFLAAAVSARYAKVDIDNSGRAPEGYLDIGHLWLSDLWQPERNFSYGAQSILADASQTVQSIGGQDYTDVRNKVRAERFEFNALREAEIYGQIADLDGIAGTYNNVLYAPDPGGTYQNAKALIGRLTELGAVELNSQPTRARAFEVKERI